MNEKCLHQYKLYFQQIKVYYCFSCNSILGEEIFSKKETKKYRKVSMPPMFESFTKKRWEELSPWPYLDFELAKENHVYFGCLYNREYIILPVLSKDDFTTPVFYQARDIRKDIPHGKKYLGPKGVKKQIAVYWHRKGYTTNWFICEGLADAIYMSQFGNSIALMGLNYDGSMDEWLIEKNIFLCLDNDYPGNIASINLAIYLKRLEGSDIYFVPLERGKDPVDYRVSEIKKLLKSLTG